MKDVWSCIRAVQLSDFRDLLGEPLSRTAGDQQSYLQRSLLGFMSLPEGAWLTVLCQAFVLEQHLLCMWWSSCSRCFWRCRSTSRFPVLGSVIKCSSEQGKTGGQELKDAHKANCVCKTTALFLCCSHSASEHSPGMEFLRM